jgi:hypothetical protein
MFTNKISKFKWLFCKDKSWDYLEKCDVLFIVYDINCNFIYNDKPYATLLDSYKEKLEHEGMKCLKVMGPFSIQLANFNSKILNFNGSFSRAHLLRKIYTFFFKEKYFGTEYIYNVWQLILLKLEPKRIISIYPSESLCIAARNLKIDIAELQHGVINDSHPAYGHTFKINTPYNLLPTTYICFDQTAINTLSKWVNKYDIRVELIKNPWSERFINNNINDDLVKYSVNINQWINKLEYDKTILISLGWGWEDCSNIFLKEKYNCELNMPHFHSISLPLIEIILNRKLKVNWLFRLHPVQLQNHEKKLIFEFFSKHFLNFKNVLWNEPSQAPLTIILQNIDLHLTIDSTITSEAAFFNIKSGLISPNPKPINYIDGYFLDELKSGSAEFVPNDIDELFYFINNNLNL